MSRNIIVYGSLAYDHRLAAAKNIGQLYAEGKGNETLLCSVHSELGFGGNGGNIVWNLAKIGTKSTLISTVGFDGKAYLDRLEKADIDVSHIRTIDELPTTHVFFVSDEERSIALYDDRASHMRTFSIDQKYVQDAIVHVGPGKPGITIQALQTAFPAADTVVWDPGQDLEFFSEKDIETCIRHSSFIIVNDTEELMLQKLSKRTIDEISDTVSVIVTKGKDGASIHSQKVITNVPVRSPIQFTSAWGAGDAFRAGLLQALEKGKLLHEAVESACDIAAKVVAIQGTQL